MADADLSTRAHAAAEGRAHRSAFQRGVMVFSAGAVLGTLLYLGWEIAGGQLDPGRAPDLLVFAHDLALVLASPTFALLGLLIVWKASEQPGAPFAALFLGAYGLWGLAIGGWFEEGVLRLGYVTVLDVLAHTTAVRFTQLFPRPLEAADVRSLAKGKVSGALSGMLGALLDPRLFWPVMVGVGLAARFISVPFVYVGHVIGVSVLASAYLFAGYRAGEEKERRRIFWLMEGALVFVATELLLLSVRVFGLLGIVQPDMRAWHAVVHPFQTWAAIVCFALAIFFYGAFDARLVVRRTTVASLGGTLVVILFITMETAVSETLEAVFGFESQVGTIVGGVAVALLFRPIVQKIEGRLGGLDAEDGMEVGGG